MTDPLSGLSAAGVSIWLEDLSRLRLTTGTLDRLVRERHVTGVTSNPTIFATAIGGSDAYDDQIEELAGRLRRRIRVEHWANARRQGAIAAKAMLGHNPVYDRSPYFFSDQYDLGLEYTGYIGPAGYDDVVLRGDPGTREFIVFWLADGRVAAGMNVNTWDVADLIDKVIRSNRSVDVHDLSNPDVPLDQL